ncbi:MAG: sensor histidine kinase N-terminal domain-containing protein [Planctomycetaceae bacterium]|nr:sensor histidine kinase N-terminal domain-containing protein [Planctomycetales bacterium]MCB9922809.1 sensor histidine kinase N-terminal domain-containing protein [Planctomycetaceae bacterium]
MKWSLRSRLLLGIGTTVVAGFAAAVVAIFLAMRASLVREFDLHLAAQTHALATLIKQEGDRIEIPFVDRPLPEFARKVRPEYYQVWADDGNVLARSRRLERGNLTRTNGSLAAPGFRYDDLPDGRRGRLAAVEFFPVVDGERLDDPHTKSGIDFDDDNVDRVNFSDRRRVTLVVARDTSEIDQAISELAWTLFAISTIVTLTVLGVVSWLLTRSLQPLRVLAKQISNLDASDLNQRFELSDLPDELVPVVARLNELLSRLEESFWRERALTADVAHELRTPLAGLRTTLEVTLCRSRSPKEYAKTLRTCETICIETQRVVESLLSLARADSGTIPLENSNVDVPVFVTELWESYNDRANERFVTASFDGPLTLCIQTDADKLRVVLSNLFDNAVDYTNQGGNISVGWRRDGHGVRFTVANTGCELDKDQLSKVFNRFWRADVARAATGTHVGVGLALCRRIIEMLGGSIEAVNRDGMFVTSLYLPCDLASHSGTVLQASNTTCS